ncbi:MAG: DNA polymerase, partial [Clostridia bacterium]|nr:DNA polymerase [Clostridia bacterium]
IAQNKQDIYAYYQILKKQKQLYCDIEGSTLPYSVSIHPHQVISISFTYRDNEAFVFPLKTLKRIMPQDATDYAFQAITLLLKDPNIGKSFHYGKYDVSYLDFAEEIETNGYNDETIIKAYLEHEKQERGLKALTNKFEPDMFEYDKPLHDYIAQHDEANPKKGGSYLYIPNHILLPYNGLDTIALFRYSRRITPIIENNPRLKWLYHSIMMPVWLRYIKMEKYGWPIDRIGLQEESKRLKEVVRINTKKVMDYLLARGIREAYNLNSPEDCAQILIRLGELPLEEARLNYKGVPTADVKDIIKCINAGSEVARYINIARNADSMDSKYCVSFLHDIDLNDRYHAEYNLTEVDTGRTSEKRIQTITRKYRKFFTAGEMPDGSPRIFFEHDYSQLEIRLMACRARVKLMLEIYKRNGDIHRLTGSSAKYIVHDEAAMNALVESRDPDRIIKELMTYFGTFDKNMQKVLRQQAKPVNFSFLYRAYHLSVMNKINSDNDKMIKDLIMESYETEDMKEREKIAEKIEELKQLYITEEQAKTFEKAFFTLYPEVRVYHEECCDEAKATGIITSPFGRMKHISEATLNPNIRENLKKIAHALNSSTNMPIQSLGGDCKFMAVLRTAETFEKECIDAHLIGDLHDALFTSVAPEHAETAFDILQDKMCIHKGEFDWTAIDIPVDCKVGFNWGKSTEIKNKEELRTWLRENGYATK